MIDYEKIREELCKIYDDMHNEESITENDDIKHELWIGRYYLENLITVINYINTLKSKNKIKPKYEIGQEVYFYVDDEQKIYTFNIAYIINDEDGISYIDKDDEFCVHEKRLYPSRQALIESQIKYWQSLKDEAVTDCNRLECKHESDEELRSKGGCIPEHFKCKKCGEFYR